MSGLIMLGAMFLFLTFFAHKAIKIIEELKSNR